MAADVPLISDEDLQAPLELAKNYKKLANDFDAVTASMALMVSKLETQDATIAQLTEHTQKLEKEIKSLDEANKKAAKSAAGMAAGVELADQATGGLISSSKALLKQLWALVANPWGAVLAALAVTLGAVATYFKTSAAGADKFEKIMSALKGVADFLIAKFAKLGEELVKMFEDGNAVGELLSGIFDVVINRIAGAIDAFTNLIKIVNILSKYSIGDIIKGNLKPEDIKALNTAVTDLGKSALQAITGIGTAAKEAKDAAKSLVEATTAAQEHGNKVAARILSNAQAQLEIEKLLFAAKDKTNHTTEERLEFLKKALALSERELKIDMDLAKEKERIFATELAIQKGVIKTQDEANKALAYGLTLEQEKLLATLIDTKQTTELNELKAASINMEQKFFAEQKKNIKEIGALEKELDEEAIARAERMVRKRIRDLEAIGAKQREVNARQAADQQALNKDNERMANNFGKRLTKDQKGREEEQKKRDKKREEDLKKKEQTEQIVKETAIQAVDMIGQEMFARRQERLAIEAANLEAQREKELKAAGDDERKKLAINRKFDREQARIKTKQAQADKQAAIFGIIINTAMGIMKAAPVVPLMIATGIMGAIQLALVASKPLPKFAGGTGDAPNTFIAGEKGREIVSRNGQAMLTSGPTLFTDMEGAQVFSNKDTEEILGDASDLGPAISYGSRMRRQYLRAVAIEDSMKEQTRWLKKIADKDGVDFYVDEEGFHKYSNRVAIRNSRINKRFYGR